MTNVLILLASVALVLIVISLTLSIYSDFSDWLSRRSLAAREVARLRNQVAVAKKIVYAGLDLMTKEQVGQWSGVRSFLEQDTSEYEPFDERPVASRHD